MSATKHPQACRQGRENPTRETKRNEVTTGEQAGNIQGFLGMVQSLQAPQDRS